MSRVVLLLPLLCLLGCAEPAPPSNQVEGEVETSSDWYRVTALSSMTFILEEPTSSQGNVSYLLVGEDRAILFDTGSGENEAVDGLKIRNIIEELTDIPVTLLLSHFHFDHVQNVSEFDAVAFPDLPFLRERVSADGILTLRREDLFIGDDLIPIEVGEWLPLDRDIDLGNRTIRLVNIPGHTRESVAIIDETNREAYLGDFLYNGALFLFSNDDLIPYGESALLLSSSLGPEYRLFGAHGEPEVPNEELQNLQNLLAGIQDGSFPGREGEVWDMPVLGYRSPEMSLVIFQR
jgi:hydroxyacylglutathione hydrolase